MPKSATYVAKNNFLGLTYLIPLIDYTLPNSDMNETGEFLLTAAVFSFQFVAVIQ